MIKFYQKYFIESIFFDDVNSDQLRHSNYRIRNIHKTDNKPIPFQVYPETELECKYTKPLYNTQYSEVLVENEQGFEMITGKIIIHPMATSHSTSDENSYIPVKFLKKTQETLVEKKTTRQRQYTFTRTITNEKHSFWRISL